jgi:hypothetical protein
MGEVMTWSTDHPNRLLNQARNRLRSPSGSGRELSRQELAEAVNTYLWQTHQIVANLDGTYIGHLEQGRHRWPTARRREAFRHVLAVGSPIRTGYPTPPAGPRNRNSSADAVIIAPATDNTINKLALGINDTYALNVAAEAIGRGTPVVVLPFVNTALASRRPFKQAVAALRTEDVKIIFSPGQWTPHPPGTGADHLDEFPWKTAALRTAANAR